MPVASRLKIARKLTKETGNSVFCGTVGKNGHPANYNGCLVYLDKLKVTMPKTKKKKKNTIIKAVCTEATGTKPQQAQSQLQKQHL